MGNYFNYGVGLTQQEAFEVDQQVKQNRKNLKDLTKKHGPRAVAIGITAIQLSSSPVHASEVAVTACGTACKVSKVLQPLSVGAACAYAAANPFNPIAWGVCVISIASVAATNIAGS